MDNKNTKTILDKTFMLLEQAINEKKAEQNAPQHKRESPKDGVPTKTCKNQTPKR